VDDRFDQEFYRSGWQRVLPLGPDGIQPYVRTSGTSPLPGLEADLRSLVATVGGIAQGVVAFGRVTAQSISLGRAPRARRQRPSRRVAHQAAHPAACQAVAPRCVSEMV
jgi:hypothetical protein